MVTLKTIDSSILSLIILIVIALNMRSRFEISLLRHKLFVSLIRLNMALIIIDILSWAYNGKPGGINPILNGGFNLLLYVIEPLASILWLLYADLQVFQDERRIRRFVVPLSLLALFNALASVASFWTKWFFYMTPDNLYQRGDYYWIHIAFCYSILAYSFLFVIANKDRLEKSHFYALLLFVVPQTLGGIVQIFFYGISLSWSGMMLSLLIVYFYIQDRSLKTDYLTGAYNRRQLDHFIKRKIRENMGGKSFSVILIDLNDFKRINDTFGHDVGDEALRNAVHIVKSCLCREDFIARYGGDEFYVVINIDDPGLLALTVERIDGAVRRFNLENNLPYNLSFSMGYDVYSHEHGLSSEDFLKHIDALMYKNKESRLSS